MAYLDFVNAIGLDFLPSGFEQMDANATLCDQALALALCDQMDATQMDMSMANVMGISIEMEYTRLNRFM